MGKTWPPARPPRSVDHARVVVEIREPDDQQHRKAGQTGTAGFRAVGQRHSWRDGGARDEQRDQQRPPASSCRLNRIGFVVERDAHGVVEASTGIGIWPIETDGTGTET